MELIKKIKQIISIALLVKLPTGKEETDQLAMILQATGQEPLFPPNRQIKNRRQPTFEILTRAAIETVGHLFWMINDLPTQPRCLPITTAKVLMI